MDEIAELINEALSAPENDKTLLSIREKVKALTGRFPIYEEHVAEALAAECLQ
jgi:glycine/serine hydroxymethyltransferase